MSNGTDPSTVSSTSTPNRHDHDVGNACKIDDLFGHESHHQRSEQAANPSTSTPITPSHRKKSKTSKKRKLSRPRKEHTKRHTPASKKTKANKTPKRCRKPRAPSSTTEADTKKVVGNYDVQACAAAFPDETHKFDVILADVPWSYSPSGSAKFAGPPPYPVMTLEQLKQLPVPRIAAKNCALLLWTTASRLPEALQLFDVWGFDFKTIFLNWIKCNKNGKPFCGLGHYTRGCTEYLLIGGKGRIFPMRRQNNLSSLLSATPPPPAELTTTDNTGSSNALSRENQSWEQNMEHIGRSVREQHSAKPELAFDVIHAFFGCPADNNVRFVELFARRTRPGWSAWGLELDKNQPDGKPLYFLDDANMSDAVPDDNQTR